MTDHSGICKGELPSLRFVACLAFFNLLKGLIASTKTAKFGRKSVFVLWDQKEAAWPLQKRSGLASLKVLKTIYWLAHCIFSKMLYWIDFKNIFFLLGFSHFSALLSFLFIFLLQDRLLLEGACTCHVALHVSYACAH